MFCPFCAQPETGRRERGNGETEIRFACTGETVERYGGQTLMVTPQYRPPSCIMLENANPHRMARDIQELRSQLNAETSLRIDYVAAGELEAQGQVGVS